MSYSQVAQSQQTRSTGASELRRGCLHPPGSHQVGWVFGKCNHVVGAFVPDLRPGCFRPGLRIKGLRVAPGVDELTWAPDGRATWSYGRQQVRGAQHIVWRRVGTHAILTGS